jgi:hypothetical protein
LFGFTGLLGFVELLELIGAAVLWFRYRGFKDYRVQGFKENKLINYGAADWPLTSNL